MDIIGHDGDTLGVQRGRHRKPGEITIWKACGIYASKPVDIWSVIEESRSRDAIHTVSNEISYIVYYDADNNEYS